MPIQTPARPTSMALAGLVHDVLDRQLVDRSGAKMGRVDGITIELREDAPPRVAELLVGGTVRADRVGGPVPLILRLLAWATEKRTVVTRIPFEVVREIADVVTVDVAAGATGVRR